MNDNNPILLSGAAQGADAFWSDTAVLHGYEVMHFSFEGHHPNVPLKYVYCLSEDELTEANEHVEFANETLKRRVPIYKPWIYNLLRRNWYQVRYATSLYAVGNIEETANIKKWGETKRYDESLLLTNTLKVSGGTAWAVQMLYDQRKNTDIFFYDQKLNKILWVNPLKSNFWTEIGFLNISQHIELYDSSIIYKPVGVFAAVGTRKLQTTGCSFIQGIFDLK